MSALNWISGSPRGKRQKRIDRKLRRRQGATDWFTETDEDRVEIAAERARLEAGDVRPHVAPDERGCYGWPRTCAHYDDVDCFRAETS